MSWFWRSRAILSDRALDVALRLIVAARGFALHGQPSCRPPCWQGRKGKIVFLFWDLGINFLHSLIPFAWTANRQLTHGWLNRGVPKSAPQRRKLRVITIFSLTGLGVILCQGSGLFWMVFETLILSIIDDS